MYKIFCLYYLKPSEITAQIGPGRSTALLKTGKHLFLVLLKVIFYFGPYLRAFWGLFFIFSRVLKQIQVFPKIKKGKQNGTHAMTPYGAAADVCGSGDLYDLNVTLPSGCGGLHDVYGQDG